MTNESCLEFMQICKRHTDRTCQYDQAGARAIYTDSLYFMPRTVCWQNHFVTARCIAVAPPAVKGQDVYPLSCSPVQVQYTCLRQQQMPSHEILSMALQIEAYVLNICQPSKPKDI